MQTENPFDPKTGAAIADMINAFLKWKLPKSVRSDPCATMNEAQHPHPRYGTNLLSLPEAMQMFQEVVCPIIAEYQKSHPQQPSAGQGEGELAEAVKRVLAHWDKHDGHLMSHFGNRVNRDIEALRLALARPIPPPPPATDSLELEPDVPCDTTQRLTCVCGQPNTPGVIHRKDGPCYHQEPISPNPTDEANAPKHPYPATGEQLSK